MSGWRNEGGIGDDPNNPYNKLNQFGQQSLEDQRKSGMLTPQNDPMLDQFRRDYGNPGEKEFALRYERTRGGPNALDAVNPNAPPIDYSQADQYAAMGQSARNEQLSALSGINRGTRLEQAAAAGQAPSQAALQAGIAGNQSLQDQFAAAAQGRGPNRMGTSSAASIMGAAGMRSLGQQAALARGNEIEKANAGVLQGTGMGMERALGMGQQSAKDQFMGLQRAKYGADLAMRNRELLAQREAAYMGGEMGEVNRNAMIANAGAAETARANAENKAATRATEGAIISAGTAGAARYIDDGGSNDNPHSDERDKDQRKARGVDALLAALAHSSATYRYKDEGLQPTSQPKGEDQRFAGVMAQDLEKVPEIGHALVTDTPKGKVIENGAALSALLAAVGRQQQQINSMKGRR